MEPTTLKSSNQCVVHAVQYVSIVFWAQPLCVCVQVQISPPPHLKVLVSSPQIREELSAPSSAAWDVNLRKTL